MRGHPSTALQSHFDTHPMALIRPRAHSVSMPAGGPGFDGSRPQLRSTSRVCTRGLWRGGGSSSEASSGSHAAKPSDHRSAEDKASHAPAPAFLQASALGAPVQRDTTSAAPPPPPPAVDPMPSVAIVWCLRSSAECGCWIGPHTGQGFSGAPIHQACICCTPRPFASSHPAHGKELSDPHHPACDAAASAASCTVVPGGKLVSHAVDALSLPPETSTQYIVTARDAEIESWRNAPWDGRGSGRGSLTPRDARGLPWAPPASPSSYGGSVPHAHARASPLEAEVADAAVAPSCIRRSWVSNAGKAGPASGPDSLRKRIPCP
mmetsp:Transcript_62006/g.196017  ORF Transcript_62006/g.196017 Transcript_62006/m.196017 type:complete len:321 (+) Transcript_62006:2232-3194(+)